MKSHQKFKAKFELPFTLLSDEGHRIAEAYGVYGEKSLYGMKFEGVLRTTFLIDEKGDILGVIEKVRPLGHATEVATLLKAFSDKGGAGQQ